MKAQILITQECSLGMGFKEFTNELAYMQLFQYSQLKRLCLSYILFRNSWVINDPVCCKKQH